MNSLVDIVAYWQAKAQAKTSELATIGGTFKFVVEGPQSGIWRVACMEPVAVQEGEGEADCTVKVALDDLLSIMRKELSPQLAFIQGKLRFSGNLSLALKLKSLID